MKPRHRVVYAAVAVTAVAVAWWALQPTPRPLDVARVTRGVLVQSFEEEGRTELAHRWMVTAPIAGTLSRIDLMEGDAVRTGQQLATIEPSRAQLLDPANRARLQAEEAAAQASMQAARQRQVAAQTDADLAAREVDRMRRLSRVGAISLQALDAAEAQVSRAQATAAASAADYRAADRQRAALAALLAGQGHAGGRGVPVFAPIDGVVLHRYLQSSTAVAAGQNLLEMGDLDQLQVMVQTLSQQAVLLHLGTPAQILRWGGRGALPAHVVRIEPGGYTKVSALGVEEQRTRVWLDIDAPRKDWSQMGDGFRVEVEFHVARKQQALKVESSALFRQAARWAVYRVEHGRLQRVDVEPGMRGGTETEIRRGLREGDLVVAFPDERMHEGLRVRPLEPTTGSQR